MFRRQGEKPNVKSKLHLPPASWEQFRIQNIEERNKILPTSTMALVGFCLGTYQGKPICSKTHIVARVCVNIHPYHYILQVYMIIVQYKIM